MGAIYTYALSLMLSYSSDSTIEDILPTTFATPMFWSPEDLEELGGTATYGICKGLSFVALIVEFCLYR
jgi:hypothetical protein